MSFGLNYHEPKSRMLLQPRRGRFYDPHMRERRHVCSSCGKNYAQYSSLYTHRKYECGKSANFKCPYCPYKSKLKGNLKVHIRNQHAKFLNLPSTATATVSSAASAAGSQSEPSDSSSSLVPSSLPNEIDVHTFLMQNNELSMSVVQPSTDPLQ
ncbi:hypothetical protein LSTR_LSTR000965 [Laodelphax striatellus]|uniref:C2H2-type domain-containing protein n=1 Tax=Laodelphax striatellus TaxID=195883 RepID=A0A482X0V1_LAOST|nr:hypothetical protein LSTR_LSTR000965 [Laodelphax striatellus]